MALITDMTDNMRLMSMVTGLKRKYLGLEKDESYSKRMNNELLNLLSEWQPQQQSIIPTTVKRQCIGDHYSEKPAAGCNSCFMIHKWTYVYSDGTFETVKKMVRS